MVKNISLNDFFSLQTAYSARLVNLFSFPICNKYYTCSTPRKYRLGKRLKPTQIHFTSVRPSRKAIIRFLTSWHSTKICNSNHHSRNSRQSRRNLQSFSQSLWLLSYSEADLSRNLPFKLYPNFMANAHQTTPKKKTPFSQRTNSFLWQNPTQKN